MKKFFCMVLACGALFGDEFEISHTNIYGANGDFIVLSNVKNEQSFQNCEVLPVSVLLEKKNLIIGKCAKNGENCDCEAIEAKDYYKACERDESCKFELKFSFKADDGAILVGEKNLPKIKSYKSVLANFAHEEDRLSTTILALNEMSDDDLKALAKKEFDETFAQIETEDEATEEENEFFAGIGTEIAHSQNIEYADENLLIVSEYSDFFTAGMAHNTYSTYFHNVAGDHNLTADELFSDTGAVLEIVNKQLKADYSEFIFEPEVNKDAGKFKKLENFMVQKGQLIVVSQIYEVAPFAYGNLSVRVPYEDIKPFIKETARKYFE